MLNEIAESPRLESTGKWRPQSAHSSQVSEVGRPAREDGPAEVEESTEVEGPVKVASREG